MTPTPQFNQLNFVVRNMEDTVAFYQRLGLSFNVAPDGQHASTVLPNGVSLEFDSTKFVLQWDKGWRGSIGGSTVFGFSVPSREDVDELYHELTGLGHKGHQKPYDAFWGGRYAIVEDPNGNPIGIMSPIEQERKFWPPKEPPTDL